MVSRARSACRGRCRRPVPEQFAQGHFSAEVLTCQHAQRLAPVEGVAIERQTLPLDLIQADEKQRLLGVQHR